MMYDTFAEVTAQLRKLTLTVSSEMTGYSLTLIRQRYVLMYPDDP